MKAGYVLFTVITACVLTYLFYWTFVDSILSRNSKREFRYFMTYLIGQLILFVISNIGHVCLLYATYHCTLRYTLKCIVALMFIAETMPSLLFLPLNVSYHIMEYTQYNLDRKSWMVLFNVSLVTSTFAQGLFCYSLTSIWIEHLLIYKKSVGTYQPNLKIHTIILITVSLIFAVTDSILAYYNYLQLWFSYIFVSDYICLSFADHDYCWIGYFHTEKE